MDQWIFWIIFYAISLGIGLAAGFLMGFDRGSRAARRQVGVKVKAFPCTHFDLKSECSVLAERGRKVRVCPFASAPESVAHCLYFKPLEQK